MFDFFIFVKCLHHKKKKNVFLSLSKQNVIFKHEEITQLNMQNKLQHVSRFATGIISLWKRKDDT